MAQLSSHGSASAWEFLGRGVLIVVLDVDLGESLFRSLSRWLDSVRSMELLEFGPLWSNYCTYRAVKIQGNSTVFYVSVYSLLSSISPTLHEVQSRWPHLVLPPSDIVRLFLMQLFQVINTFCWNSFDKAVLILLFVLFWSMDDLHRVHFQNIMIEDVVKSIFRCLKFIFD